MITVCNFAYSQRITYAVTTQNDTITNLTLKNEGLFKGSLLMSLQEKLTVTNKQGITKSYLPNELKSFMLYYEGEKLQFESIDNKVFGVLMYVNKVKLVKINTRNYFIYAFTRPNSGKTSYMEGKGLSRRITLNEIKKEMADCPITIKKVEDDVLKVHGEEGVIELVKDYESNCL
jgi:hypothetical protein